MFDRISDARMRLMVVLLAPVVVASTGVTAYLIGQFGLALLLVPAVTMAIVVPVWIFRPRWWGETRVHAITLMLFAAITLSILAPDPIWMAVVSKVFGWLEWPPPEGPAFWERFYVLIFFGVVFVALNHIWSRRQLLPPTAVTNRETKQEFRPQGYKELRDEFCRYMLHQLDRYDVDVHWSDADYTTLEAEIEIQKRGVLRGKMRTQQGTSLRREPITESLSRCPRRLGRRNCRHQSGIDTVGFVLAIYGSGPDCNENGSPDGCDVRSGTSDDIDANQIPDECGDCDFKWNRPAQPALLAQRWSVVHRRARQERHQTRRVEVALIQARHWGCPS